MDGENSDGVGGKQTANGEKRSERGNFMQEEMMRGEEEGDSQIITQQFCVFATKAKRGPGA